MSRMHEPSIADLIIAMIGSGKNTRTFRYILRERELSRYREKSVRTSLSRLKSKGYLNNSNQGWFLTEKGVRHTSEKNLLNFIPSPFNTTSTQSTIIAFDIPEKDRFIRRWLRNQIKIFGYKMLQQSLWIGPGPLPSAFLKRLEDLGIRKNVKTFKILKKN